jgi:hypothetical protein
MLHLRLESSEVSCLYSVRRIHVFCISSPRSAIAGLLDTRSGRQNDTKPKHVVVSSFLSDLAPYGYAIPDLTAYNTYGTKRIHRLHKRERRKNEKKTRKKREKRRKRNATPRLFQWITPG